MPDPSLVSALARSFLAGEPSLEQVIARAARTLGRDWRWLRPLALRYVDTFAGQTRPRHRDAVQFLLQDPGFRRAWSQHGHKLSVEHWLAEPQRMRPVAAAATWDIPVIESVGALADWLWLDTGELEWFADLRGLGYKKNLPRLSHYHYTLQQKRSGSVRLIEAPKRRLKKLQRQILEWILDRIPPHPAVHGFVKGRSIKTFVAPHLGHVS